MPTILVPETIMVEAIYLHHNQRIQNVYHVRTVGRSPTAADCAAATDVIKNWWTPTVNNPIRTLTNGLVSLSKIEAVSLDSVGGPFHEQVQNPILVGTQVANALPAYVSLCVRWGSAKAGRSFRGRTYMCGPHSAIGNDGLFTVAYAGQVQTAFTTLLNAFTAAGFQMVIASKYSGVQMVNGYRRGIPRASGITTPIISVSVERGPDTRRSRKIPHLV
jgi:hypothetical protein